MDCKFYSVFFEKGFEKDLKSIDKSQAKLILSWIKKHLDNSENPKIQGKPLKGNLKGYWRYRIGNYRLIVEIKDLELILVCLSVGHRKNIYNL